MQGMRFGEGLQTVSVLRPDAGGREGGFPIGGATRPNQFGTGRLQRSN